MLQVFFQVGSPCPPHEETYLNISQLGVDVIWAKCCEMKVELKLQRATLQEKRTWSRIILCTGTTCSQCHAPSYTSIPTSVLLCLAPAGWEKMQARRCYRGEVSGKEQLLTVLHPSWICFLFLPMEIKENRGGFPAVDGSRRGLSNLLLSATQ